MDFEEESDGEIIESSDEEIHPKMNQDNNIMMFEE